MTNHTSNFTTLLKEICEEEGISLNSYADEWAWELVLGEKRSFIFGYQFGLNSAVSQSICSDKGMTSELLTAHGIANVEHLCFMPPEQAFYIGDSGSWKQIRKKLDQYGKLVVKNNNGTGGDEVYRVSSQLELEEAYVKLASRRESIAVSPFLEIEQEFRVILLDGEVQVIFSKERQGVIGDGKQTLRELICEFLKTEGMPFPSIENLKNPDRVPPVGEMVPFEWRHNLGHGADVKIHFALSDPKTLTNDEKDVNMVSLVTELAKRAAEAVKIRFASVDVVVSDGELQVLEINSGVMMENLAGKSEQTRVLAKEIYRSAIHKMFQD